MRAGGQTDIVAFRNFVQVPPTLSKGTELHSMPHQDIHSSQAQYQPSTSQTSSMYLLQVSEMLDVNQCTYTP